MFLKSSKAFSVSLIEYNTKNIFLEKSYTNMVENLVPELVPDPF